ncbi:ester cyclase [Streptomyces sp. NPDC048496]|uniref:ester cyclase n=1 Tax=Streptomyces sp. NPDC048496 TaxID=3365558 RepID=UPI00372436CC
MHTHNDQQGFGTDLRKQREDVAIGHVVAMLLRSAGRPRGVCRIVPFGEQPLVGDDAIRRHFDGMLTAFPDLEHEVLSIHHTADVVILEGWFNGTQSADWQGIPNRGQRMELPVTVLSQFDGEFLVDGTLYYDHTVAARQLI